MKRLVLLSIVTASSFFISMCEKKDVILGGKDSFYEGFVKDSATQLSAESIMVTPFDTTPQVLVALTDSIGFFRVEVSGTPGDITFFFRKTGYVTAQCTLKAGRRDTIFIQKQ